MRDYMFVNIAAKGEEVYGCLYLNGVKVGATGWWRTTDEAEAKAKAIEIFEANEANERGA